MEKREEPKNNLDQIAAKLIANTQGETDALQESQARLADNWNQLRDFLQERRGELLMCRCVRRLMWNWAGAGTQ